MTKSIRKPKLTFADKPLKALLRELLKSGTLMVADPFNHEKVSDLGNTVKVLDNSEDQIKRIRKNEYSRLIAIGGCTALDIGRACAVGRELIVIPTILSTDCISLDKSVLKNEDGENRLVKTAAPNETIISIPALLDTSPELLSKWSASGFGDLFANIGAALEQESGKGKADIERIKRILPEISGALSWAATSFRNFNAATLKKLASYCHNASFMICETGRQAGGEHKLYHAMKSLQDYPNNRPTHGQLVAVGTLITARIASEKNGNFSIYEELRKAFLNLGLPLDYSGLAAAGIEKEHLFQGIESVPCSLMIGDFFSHGDFSLIDRVFGKPDKTRIRERHFSSKGLKRAIDEIKTRHKNGYIALIEEICRQIREYYEMNGKPKLVFGLSGGIDSTVVAYLAVKAVGKDSVVPITMPAWEGDKCVEMAFLAREGLGMEDFTIGISDMVNMGICKLGRFLGNEPDRITKGNIASRTRVNLLYAIARELNGRVIGTGNRTELLQGYTTKYGTPGSCDFGILDGLYKTDVYEIAKIIGIPEEIIRQKPTTGFFEGQVHEEELGAALEEQDAAVFLLFDRMMEMEDIIRDYGASRHFIKTIIGRYDQSEHKRMPRQSRIRLDF